MDVQSTGNLCEPGMVILVVTAFSVQSAYHRIKDKSPGQLMFGRDMILPIKHVADWRYIRQRR